VTTVRSVCPQCGDLHLYTNQVTVRTRADQWAYRLQCPTCGARIVRPTSARIARLLIDAGCPIESWTLPPRGPRVGLPITEQDVTRFVEEFTEWSTDGQSR